jgi:hypothetical protein
LETLSHGGPETASRIDGTDLPSTPIDDNQKLEGTSVAKLYNVNFMDFVMREIAGSANATKNRSLDRS